MSVPNSTKNVKSEFSAKSQRKSFEYKEIQTLTTEDELTEFQQSLKSQGLHKKSEINGKWERIITYECEETKRGCKYVLIIRTSHDDLKSLITHRTCGHQHLNPKNSNLTKEIKALMSMYTHLPASRIQRKLKEAGLPVLPKLQITNFLNRERKKKRESAAVENPVARFEVERKRGRPKKIS
uniref:Uncharacterized protein n=1 Tax=Panagrolaimus sp. PS1159 TaxID=55785 RepID=A0AC35G902_9BILA